MIVTIGGIPVYDALILDNESGMMKISLVDDPAVMSNFQAFDNTKKMVMYSIADEEKRLVRGVVMRADFPIYRRDKEMGEYYIIYKADTIRQMAEKYLVESRQNNINLMHQEGSDVDGVQMVQFFIKDTGAGINPDGFDVADGTLFGEFHITNDEVWDAVKDGTYKGFSLEGYFDLVPETDVQSVETIVDSLDGKFSKQSNSKLMSKLNKIKAALVKILTEMGNVTTDKGILAWDGEEDLKVGDAVYIEDAEGNRTTAEDGDYKTDDGKTIRVVDGKVAELLDPEAEVAPEAAPEETPEATPEDETKMGKVATDKGELSWNGEEDLKAGDEVFVEKDGEVVPAEDGDYTTEDGKVIKVVDGKVSEIADAEAEVAPEDTQNEEMAALKAENEALKAENESLKAENAKFKAMSAAKPAHEEVEASSVISKTGDRGLDRLAARLQAARK